MMIVNRPKSVASKKGVVLLIAVLSLTLCLSIGASLLMRNLSEKKSVDVEKFIIQADFLADGGANHGLAELKKRISAELTLQVAQISNSNTFRRYLTNPLGFLIDYAYIGGEERFRLSDDGNQAILNVNPLGLLTNIDGSYSARIVVTSGGSENPPNSDVFIFRYNYEIKATGTVSSINKNINLFGNFVVTVSRDNFAKFALFTNQHRSPQGKVVWFTNQTNFQGPVHTNDRFSFANNPSAHFTDDVTQHLTTARFYNNGRELLLDANANANIDVPIFDTTFERGVAEINLESSLTSNDLKTQALGTMQEPGQNGIYVPNNNGEVTGGIYIRGDANEILLATDANNNPTFRITQGSTTKVITVNYNSKTTRVETIGGSSVEYAGVPDGIANEGIIIYCKSDILSLRGTVQSNTKMTVSSERDIVITNHLRYQNYNPSPLNAEGFENLLGIISWGGNVRIGTAAPNDIEIHGIVMAPHGVFTVDDYDSGPSRGIATLLGGTITDKYGPFGTFSGTQPLSGYGRNFVYDPRVLRGYIPPYFPYLENYRAIIDGLDTRPVWKRS